MAMDMEWQVASSAARATGLAEGDTQNRDDDDQAKAGGMGKRQVPKPVTRTLWAEEDEQGEAQGDDERGEEEDEVREGEGGVNSGDKERIVAFIRRMAFNVGPDAQYCARHCEYMPRTIRPFETLLALWRSLTFYAECMRHVLPLLRTCHDLHT